MDYASCAKEMLQLFAEARWTEAGRAVHQGMSGEAAVLYDLREHEGQAHPRELSQRLGREPTVGELAAATGLEPEDIAAADTAVLTVASLQEETGEDGFSLEAVLGDDGIEDELVEKLALRHAIDALPERERMVILLRFYRNFTQDRVSKVLGVSQVQVSRIERRAVAHLREALTE